MRGMQAKISSLLIFLISVFSGCKKGSDAGTQPPPPTPPAGPTILKDASGVPVGVGISYSLMKNNTSYSSLVKAQFDRVSAEYQMKHVPWQLCGSWFLFGVWCVGTFNLL